MRKAGSKRLLIVGKFKKDWLIAILNQAETCRYKKLMLELDLEKVSNWRSFDDIWISDEEYKKYPFLQSYNFNGNIQITIIAEKDKLLQSDPKNVVYFDQELNGLVGIQALHNQRP